LSGTHSVPRATPVAVDAKSRRYLILTYLSEFERIHYPLPLTGGECRDTGRLVAWIKDLQQQLKAAKDGAISRKADDRPSQRVRDTAWVCWGFGC